MLQKDACSQRAPVAPIPISFLSTGIAPFAPYHKGIEELSREDESPGAPYFLLNETLTAIKDPLLMISEPHERILAAGYDLVAGRFSHSQCRDKRDRSSCNAIECGS
jgi:hypothetical protein